MPTLSVPRQEAFARALAMELPQTGASSEAGYTKDWRHARERAETPDILARVTALRDALQLDETSDVAPVIEALMRLAKKAGDMPTAAGMAAARGLLAEAAKLKGRLQDKGETAGRVEPVDPRYLPLSHEDWMAEYGHLGERAP